MCRGPEPTWNGVEVYSLTEGRMNSSSLARNISHAYSMSFSEASDSVHHLLHWMPFGFQCCRYDKIMGTSLHISPRYLPNLLLFLSMLRSGWRVYRSRIVWYINRHVSLTHWRSCLLFLLLPLHRWLLLLHRGSSCQHVMRNFPSLSFLLPLRRSGRRHWFRIDLRLLR